MILDNENENIKVHEWITKYTQTGKLSIVTGYFTVGALAYLSNATKAKIDEYKFILGDIVNFDFDKDRVLDLLNEDINIDASLKLSKVAQEAVAGADAEGRCRLCSRPSRGGSGRSPGVQPSQDQG